VPLHIFEPRYQELIGECLESDAEFRHGLRGRGRRP
jgi:Lon protease-like protein